MQWHHPNNILVYVGLAHTVVAFVIKSRSAWTHLRKIRLHSTFLSHFHDACDVSVPIASSKWLLEAHLCGTVFKRLHWIVSEVLCDIMM